MQKVLVPLLTLGFCMPLGAQGFVPISNQSWTPQAVRRTLQAVALGGQADDSEVQALAALSPADALQSLLPNDLGQGVSLQALMPALEAVGRTQAERDLFTEVEEYKGLPVVFLWAISRQNADLVAHRLGLFEAWYHLATTNDVISPGLQMLFYDQLQADLGQPYVRLLSRAAASSAIAMQYGHHKNRIKDGHFEGNDDFAREYHQLFFGILGEGDPLHESQTIEHTAVALTGIDVRPNGTPEYSPQEHAPVDLTILGQVFPYSPGMTMPDRLDQISDVAIDHPESLQALPRLFVTHFGEDEPPAWVLQQAEETWLRERRLLPFLRAYLGSTAFHRGGRARRVLPIDLVARVVNLVLVPQTQPNPAFLNLLHRLLKGQGQKPFEPAHAVFGDLRGPESHSSPESFRKWWGSLMTIEDFSGSQRPLVQLPPGLNQAGGMTVGQVSAWIWERLIADEGRGFSLEVELQLNSLLATGEGYQGNGQGNLRAINRALRAEHFPSQGAEERILSASFFALACPDAFVDRGAN